HCSLLLGNSLYNTSREHLVPQIEHLHALHQRSHKVRTRIPRPRQRAPQLTHPHATHPRRNHHNALGHQERQARNQDQQHRTPPPNRHRLHLRHPIGTFRQLPSLFVHPPQVNQRDHQCGSHQQHSRHHQQFLQRKHFS